MLITGQQFNEQCGCLPFVKLTNESCIHNGLEFKEGLNKDTMEFNSEKICGPGGYIFAIIGILGNGHITIKKKCITCGM